MRFPIFLAIKLMERVEAMNNQSNEIQAERILNLHLQIQVVGYDQKPVPQTVLLRKAQISQSKYEISTFWWLNLYIYII